MDKPITFSEWLGTQGNMVLLHANCCRIAYEAGQQSQQAKVEELQRRNQMLNDNIKEQGQKLVYQNEVIETQAEKLLGLRDEKAELQKRVDAALKETQYALQYVEGDMRGNHEFLQMAMIRTFKALEQVLKGEG
ncbi:hypothetical protein GHT87_04045 [Acinetobacter baumannii]|uniref:hypothetical protein n=1 Tax=Acinetobacter baumannii TaxID=470 RepID=UPI001EEDDCE4|nr:hypothetical protein [Acinetobacter baumannii]MCG6649627.1 hypothetical protein [Acinetobacter baumannii]